MTLLILTCLSVRSLRLVKVMILVQDYLNWVLGPEAGAFDNHSVYSYSDRKMSYTIEGKIRRSKEAALRKLLVIDIAGLI